MKAVAYMASISALVMSLPVQGQDLTNLTEEVAQFGETIPGISCKTRTNNEATVRNLAKGVYNRDSAQPVAVNCGWTTPKVWGRDFAFANDARADGTIQANWVRTAGTAPAQANQGFCTIFAAGADTTPSPPNVAGTLIGTLAPDFTGSTNVDEEDTPFVHTNNVEYPGFAGPGSTTADAMFTAFCRIPQGVRIQSFDMNALSVGVHP